MEVRNLNKNIREIFQSNYVVPLYQRNFAWTDEEIHQLLRDIYENYEKDPGGFYFIGTLVVLKRKNGDFEVIDGQQRLTTLSLISKKLDDKLKKSKLKYDSRPEVEAFLEAYYQRGEVSVTTTNHLVSHFKEAIGFIENVDLKKEPLETLHFIDFLKDESLTEFVEYFFNQVILVKVEIPGDTDVAHYFEIMNNRGEQLEKHEIVKARLLKSIKEDKVAATQFAKIWDACSQMNKPIQQLFNKTDREHFFGKEYDSYDKDAVMLIKRNPSNDDLNQLTIDDILSGKTILSHDTEIREVKGESFEAIIDFPNFLMHVLKLYCYEEEDLSIPFNADDLLPVFLRLEAKIDSREFIDRLLFYRVVFDRFMVAAIEDEKSEDNSKWVLHKPKYYLYEKKNTDRLIYENSFKKLQEPIIKCLSMLQVTFRTKKYKNYLQNILSWFKIEKDLQITDEAFLKKLNGLVLKIYNDNESFKALIKEPPYCEGTKTPHFLFNFIDYLYWTESSPKLNFEFKYRNSVEHHLPQSFRSHDNADVMDCLGNLCLVSKSGNSRMNNESPKGKADIDGKFIKGHLPAKQLTMYNLTNKEGKWGKNEILGHYYDIVDLINRRNEILKAHD